MTLQAPRLRLLGPERPVPRAEAAPARPDARRRRPTLRPCMLRAGRMADVFSQGCDAYARSSEPNRPPRQLDRVPG